MYRYHVMISNLSFEDLPKALSSSQKRNGSHPHLIGLLTRGHEVPVQAARQTNPSVHRRRGRWDHLNDGLRLDAVYLDRAIVEQCGDVRIIQTCSSSRSTRSDGDGGWKRTDVLWVA